MQRVYRNPRGAIIGGVCLGIADHFNVDPTIVRLAWALTVFLGGSGAVAYLIAWVIIPVRPDDDWAEPRKRDDQQLASSIADNQADAGTADSSTGTTAAAGEGPVVMPPRPPSWQADKRVRPERRDTGGPHAFGLILIMVGAFWLVRNLVPHWGWHRYWPLALVAIGLYMIVTAFRGESR